MGPPLGVIEDARYAEVTVVLEPGDALLLYTDGVNEARASTGEMLGEEVGYEVLRDQSAAADIVNALVKRVVEHTAGASANDDVCTISLSRDSSEAG